ncbi:1,4-dihydroxy-2-naphthoyl-CoA synthase [Rhodococcus sp. T7]|nr:1,4-dihydroxy-2-naphthoyl-CoA synthase [Rhodococcus sp. T7]KAF0966702.1 1,4-dihydroxy-2-naphthoyl-CoA synthase [Rhodococcus sp. T7]
MPASENGAVIQTGTAVTDGDLSYSVDGPLAVITLNRPRAHNAFTVLMARRLAEAADAARRDEAVHVVIVTGAGEKAFSAGGDLGELIPRLTRGELDILIPDPSKRYFSDVFKPVIAAVNGICGGAGWKSCSEPTSALPRTTRCSVCRRSVGAWFPGVAPMCGYHSRCRGRWRGSCC